MPKDLELAIAAAKKAGKLVRQGYSGSKIVHKKGRQDLVTSIDRQAETSIINDLKPTGYNMLGEESGDYMITKGSKKWIIDPIDGTANFVKGIPFFAVSIGLMDGDGQLILGVVYDPLRDECYWAEEGKGAYMNGAKIHVVDAGGLEDSAVLLEHGRSQPAIATFIAATNRLMSDDGAIIMRQGSTALMLCYVAKGSASAFVSYGDELYDYAAGLVVVKEAGGVVSDWLGQPRDSANSYVLAGTAGTQPEIVSRIRHLQVIDE